MSYTKQYRTIQLPGGKVMSFDRSVPGWVCAFAGLPNRFGVAQKPKHRTRRIPSQATS